MTANCHSLAAIDGSSLMEPNGPGPAALSSFNPQAINGSSLAGTNGLNLASLSTSNAVAIDGRRVPNFGHRQTARIRASDLRASLHPRILAAAPMGLPRSTGRT